MGKVIEYKHTPNGVEVIETNDGIAEPPRWTAMREALEGNAGINNKLFLSAAPNGYSLLRALLIQGEMGHGDEDAMQRLLSDRHPQSGRRLIFHPAAVDWDNNERTQINQYFTNHYFKISIAI